MNGTRLSLFQPIQKLLGADAATNGHTAFFFRNLAAGAACGACGAVVGSPLFLIKARLQSQSSAHDVRSAGAGQFRCVYACVGCVIRACVCVVHSPDGHEKLGTLAAKETKVFA